jgi:hypothetical protein
MLLNLSFVKCIVTLSLLICANKIYAQNYLMDFGISDPFNLKYRDTTDNTYGYQRLKILQPHLDFTKVDKKRNTSTYSIGCYFDSQERNSRTGPVNVNQGNINTFRQQSWRINCGYGIGKAIYYDNFLLRPAAFVTVGYRPSYQSKATYKYISPQDDTLYNNATFTAIPANMELRLGASFSVIYFIKPNIGFSASCQYHFEYTKQLGSLQVTEVDYLKPEATVSYSRKDNGRYLLNDALVPSFGVTLLFPKKTSSTSSAPLP